MTRPSVSVVMPFAGSAAEARAALDSLLGLELRDGDELIVADNSGTVPEVPGVRVISALAEPSPAHARNAGAEHAGNDWILFLDADCRPREGLLDAYFATPVEAGVGALAGGVEPAGGATTLAARYGAARNFLSQDAHLAHPYRPRAVAANLLVRRAAFEEIGGFFEGLRAAEDTDFSWRLQEAGWLLESRAQASVEHRYRATVPELRRQWRGYAAGRAWLGRRYEEFKPEPAVVRAARRVVGRGGGARGGGSSRGGPPGPPGTPARDLPAPPRMPDRDASPAFLALDALLALDELVGFVLSNHPSHGRSRHRPFRSPPRYLWPWQRLPRGSVTYAPLTAHIVLVADRFPSRGDALVDEALAVPRARVEAARRPDVIDRRAAGAVPIDYREDDGIGARVWALTQLLTRHPGRCTRSLVEKADYAGAFSTRLLDGASLAALAPAPSLGALAPAALRLAREPGARVRALGPGEAEATAQRLAALAGTPLDEPRRP